MRQRREEERCRENNAAEASASPPPGPAVVARLEQVHLEVVRLEPARRDGPVGPAAPLDAVGTGIETGTRTAVRAGASRAKAPPHAAAASGQAQVPGGRLATTAVAAGPQTVGPAGLLGLTARVAAADPRGLARPVTTPGRSGGPGEQNQRGASRVASAGRVGQVAPVASAVAVVPVAVALAAVRVGPVPAMARRAAGVASGGLGP